MNVILAPLEVLAIDVDPGTGDVCVGGKTGSTPSVTRVGPNGQTLFATVPGALDGSTLTGVRVSPADGSCWFLTDDSIGRILADGTLDRQQ